MKHITAFLLLSLCLMFQLGAEDVQIVSLDEAIASAEKNSISLEEARVSLNQALRNQNAVMTTFMPELSLNAGLSTGVDFPGADGSLYGEAGPLSDAAFSGLTVSTGASASFSFSGSMITDGETRRLAKERASLGYSSTWQTLQDTITEAYWNISSGELSVKAAELSVSDAREQYESASKMYESGLADELSLIQAELSLRQAELQLKTLEDSLEIMKSSFRNMTGIEGDFTTEELPAPVFLSLPDADTLFSIYSAGNLSVRSAENALRSAENASNTARLSTYVPVLTASVGYSYSGSGYRSYSGTSLGYSNAGNGLTGSVAITVPISSMLPGSSADMAIKDADDSVTLASLALQDAKNTLLETIRERVISIEQAESNIEQQNLVVKSAERNYELSQEAFDSGLMTSDDLASARTNLLKERLNLLSMETTHLISCYQLSSALGIELDELQEEYSSEVMEN